MLFGAAGHLPRTSGQNSERLDHLGLCFFIGSSPAGLSYASRSVVLKTRKWWPDGLTMVMTSLTESGDGRPTRLARTFERFPDRLFAIATPS